jgi:hypothetical protein
MDLTAFALGVAVGIVVGVSACVGILIAGASRIIDKRACASCPAGTFAGSPPTRVSHKG